MSEQTPVAVSRSERQVAAELLRTVRGAGHRRGWGTILQDWYVGLFSVATLLLMVIGGTSGAILSPTCSSTRCLAEDHYRVAAVASALLGGLGLLLAIRAAGPAWADAPRRRWLLSTPGDRSVLLRGPLARSLAVAVALGALLGAGIALIDAGGEGRLTPARAVIAGGVGAVVALAAGWLGLLAQSGSWLPRRALRRVPDRELARAGARVDGAVSAVAMMDASGLGAASDLRAASRRGRHRSRPLRGSATTSLLMLSGLASARSARRLGGPIAGLLVAVVGGLLLGSLVAVIALGLAALALTAALARVALGLAESAALRRHLPADPRAGLAAALALPIGVASLILTAATWAVGLPLWAGVHLALVGAMAALRRTDPPPPSLGLVIATPAGALPTGLIHRLVHGPDLAIGGALLLLLPIAGFAHPALCLAVAVAGLAVVVHLVSTRSA